MNSDHFGQNIGKVIEIRSYDEEENASYGTGWFKDRNTVITNYHVLSHTEKNETVRFRNNEIRFSDSEKYESVTLLDFDIQRDIAYLRYEGEHKHSFFTVQGKCEIGERCYCIGNFSNYGLSYKEGNISLKSISLLYNDKYSSFIQCSISIGPGDSGAPLFDKSDKLLGMVTFRVKGLTGTIEQGYAYAMPAESI